MGGVGGLKRRGVECKYGRYQKGPRRGVEDLAKLTGYWRLQC